MAPAPGAFWASAIPNAVRESASSSRDARLAPFGVCNLIVGLRERAHIGFAARTRSRPAAVMETDGRSEYSAPHFVRWYSGLQSLTAAHGAAGREPTAGVSLRHAGG